MKVLPTLQIQHGRSVMNSGGGVGEDPGQQLARILELGCLRVSLLDVDAAQGKGNNREVIAGLMRQCRQSSPRVCIQVGGGIRSSDQAQFFVDHGATWLLVGTLLHKSSMVVDQLLARFHEHLTASIDAQGGEVKTSGWVDQTSQSASMVARRVRELGFRRLLFVDIPGAQEAEPDFTTAQTIAEHARLPLFMWGRFRHPQDLERASQIPGLQGVQVDAHFALEHAEALRASATGCQ